MYFKDGLADSDLDNVMEHDVADDKRTAFTARDGGIPDNRERGEHRISINKARSDNKNNRAEEHVDEGHENMDVGEDDDGEVLVKRSVSHGINFAMNEALRGTRHLQKKAPEPYCNPEMFQYAYWLTVAEWVMFVVEVIVVIMVVYVKPCKCMARKYPSS